jgi:hypothetical protein
MLAAMTVNREIPPLEGGERARLSAWLQRTGV